MSQAQAFDAAGAAGRVRQALGDGRIDIAIVLGSGLSAAVADLVGRELDYRDIPGLPTPTAKGHPGALRVGVWGSARVAAFLGRSHLYEGASWEHATRATRLAATLGARQCIVTNMSGSLTAALRPGTVALVAEHINILGGRTQRFGEARRGDNEANAALRHELSRAAQLAWGAPLPEVVYAAVPGPSYETAAEVRALRRLGADVVGMSTVPELLAARDLGVNAVALTCVANLGAGVADGPTTHDDVLRAGRDAADRLASLLAALFHAHPSPAKLPRG